MFGPTPRRTARASPRIAVAATSNPRRASLRAEPIRDASRRPTVRAYTALVQAYASDGNVEAIDATLEMMRNDGVELNCHTYTVAVNGLVGAGDARLTLEAERFVRDMRGKAGIEPSAVTYNCLLKGVLRTDFDKIESGVRRSNGGFERAERVVEEMRAFGVSPTVVTYNTLIDGVSRGEPAESMFKVLSALVRDGHRPDVVTYTTLLKHFRGARRRGRRALADARDGGGRERARGRVGGERAGGRRCAAAGARARRRRWRARCSILRFSAPTRTPTARCWTGSRASATTGRGGAVRRAEAEGRGRRPQGLVTELARRRRKRLFRRDDDGAASPRSRVCAERQACASARAPDARLGAPPSWRRARRASPDTRRKRKHTT